MTLSLKENYQHNLSEKCDRQQLQQVEMDWFQDKAQLDLTDLLLPDSEDIDTLGEIPSSTNQCGVRWRLIEHAFVD